MMAPQMGLVGSIRDALRDGLRWLTGAREWRCEAWAWWPEDEALGRPSARMVGFYWARSPGRAAERAAADLLDGLEPGWRRITVNLLPMPPDA